MSIEQMMHDVMEDTPYLPRPNLKLRVNVLTDTDETEVLGFLLERPTHTVIMMGMIRDNGLVSEYNRGTFYGVRNSEGRLEGVALIGHATLVEARTRSAIRELAVTAQFHSDLGMFLADSRTAEEFWNHYADQGQEMRFACRELLFELKQSLEDRGEVEGLRPATLEDLDLVAPVHAAMAEAESGINPLQADREGFLARCTRRIEQGRVWVVVKNKKLIFKADIQADTPDVVYLEGVYAAPEVLGTGLARKCLSKLCMWLRHGRRSICLFVNEENLRAQAFYRMCGFRKDSQYDTIFLAQEKPELLH